MYWDTAHVVAEEFDAALLRFDGWERLAGWIGTEPHPVPEPVVFEANVSITRRSDYPRNDVRWPLMSDRMLATLRAVGEFPHRAVPACLIDDTVPAAARKDAAGAWRSDILDPRFSIVQLLEHIDPVDWERSTFRRSRIDPSTVMRFSKLVLTRPSDGLPPLFRLTAKCDDLFVSAAAREALVSAGVRGVAFKAVPVA
jgi:hypothetical protein